VRANEGPRRAPRVGSEVAEVSALGSDPCTRVPLHARLITVVCFEGYTSHAPRRVAASLFAIGDPALSRVFDPVRAAVEQNRHTYDSQARILGLNFTHDFQTQILDLDFRHQRLKTGQVVPFPLGRVWN